MSPVSVASWPCSDYLSLTRAPGLLLWKQPACSGTTCSVAFRSEALDQNAFFRFLRCDPAKWLAMPELSVSHAAVHLVYEGHRRVAGRRRCLCASRRRPATPEPQDHAAVWMGESRGEEVVGSSVGVARHRPLVPRATRRYGRLLLGGGAPGGGGVAGYGRRSGPLGPQNVALPLEGLGTDEQSGPNCRLLLQRRTRSPCHSRTR